jgi:hypothetical protein
LQKYVSLFLTASDVGAAKPSPVPFLACCQKLKVIPSRVLYIGDNYEHDILGAKKVGMKAGFLKRKNIDDINVDENDNNNTYYNINNNKNNNVYNNSNNNSTSDNNFNTKKNNDTNNNTYNGNNNDKINKNNDDNNINNSNSNEVLDGANTEYLSLQTLNCNEIINSFARCYSNHYIS